MTFQSILFLNIADRDREERLSEPDFFVDLALDRIVAAVTSDKEEYGLNPFFNIPLHDVDTITYRHEFFQDLEDVRLFDTIIAFAARMRTMRQHLAQAEKLTYLHQKERWFLDAMDSYCDAVTCLVRDLSLAQFTSRGLLSFRDYINRYATSESFSSFLKQTKQFKSDLDSIRYCVLVDGLTVQASKYDGKSDYSAEIEATFERFRHGDVNGYKFEFSDFPGMNHVEAKILDLVVQLYTRTFFPIWKIIVRFHYCPVNFDCTAITICFFKFFDTRCSFFDFNSSIAFEGDTFLTNQEGTHELWLYRLSATASVSPTA